MINNSHRHNLSVNFAENRVFCMICGKSASLVESLSSSLSGHRVEMVKRVLADLSSQNIIMVASETGYLASILGVSGSVLQVADLTKDSDLLVVFQKAVFEAFGTANMHDEVRMYTYTEHG